jgi:hypothetical protein
MKINLAVPDNEVFTPLILNKEKICKEYDINLLIVSETKAADLMLKNLVDAALLSPYGYGLGVTQADYRIIPGPCLATYGFTSLASLFFRQGLKTIDKVVSPTPDDYMMKIGKLLLAETYNLLLDVEKKNGSSAELLKHADAALVWEESSHSVTALDISEEWSISYDFPLPLAFWVCRSEEYPEKISEMIHGLADNELIDVEDIIDMDSPGKPTEKRAGKLFWRWNDEIETATEQALQFLYFHQLVPEIPEVKVLGKEKSTSLPVSLDAESMYDVDDVEY